MSDTPAERPEVESTTTWRAIDKSGMTLDEVALFVTAAMKAGHEGNAKIRVRSTMGAGIKELQAKSSVPWGTT